MSSGTATLERPRFTRGPYNNRPKPGPRYTAHKIGAHSRPHTLAKVDGRTREAAILSRVRADLTEHMGGNPNIVQKMLIERCAWLAVRLALLDKKIERGEGFTQIDSNTYLAWHNSLVRTLDRLVIDDKRSRNGSRSSLSTVMAELTG